MKKNATKERSNKQRRPNKTLTIPRHLGTITATSWTPPDKNIPAEQWQAAGRALGKARSAVLWWLADWWAFGEHAYGERTEALATSCIDQSVKTLRNYGCVARAVTTSRRRDILSFTHHAEVAGLEADLQTDWLNKAEREGLSSHALREAICNSDRHGMPTHAIGPLTPPDHDAPPLAGGMFDEVDEADAAIDYPRDDAAEDQAPRAVDPAVHAERLRHTFKTFAGALCLMKMADAKLFATADLKPSRLRMASLLLQRVADLADGKTTARSRSVFAYLITALLELADEAPATLVGELSPDELRAAAVVIDGVIAASSDSNEPGHVLQARA
jgi:hypothetical protein